MQWLRWRPLATFNPPLLGNAQRVPHLQKQVYAALFQWQMELDYVLVRFAATTQQMRRCPVLADSAVIFIREYVLQAMQAEIQM